MSTARPAHVFTILLVTYAFVSLAPLCSAVGTEQLLYSFSYSGGTNPYGALVRDAAGNLYGTTNQDGATGGGTVYELLPNGSGHWGYEALYNFCSLLACADGLAPQSGLLLDSSGNLYGTTSMGGDYSDPKCGHGCGVVFELTNDNGFWTETVLYTFTGGSDGAGPLTKLVMDAAGNLYGTTFAGGLRSTYCGDGCGVVFTLRHGSDGKWTQKVLHAFCSVQQCVDGASPTGLTFDAAGNLYCTTGEVGRYGGGTLVQLTPHGNDTWTGKLLHSFGKGSDGSLPNPGLAFDASDNVYGTTNRGGEFNSGIAFELIAGANGHWTEKVLHSFCSPTSCSEGGQPLAGLTMGPLGRLFGTTYVGGIGNLGTVYALTKSEAGQWNTTAIYSSFSGNLDAPVMFDPAGNLFSTTRIGGNNNLGSVFEITP